MLDNIPDKVYKFRQWDNQYHRSIILNNEVYFSSPASLNDPYDCQMPLRYDLESKEFLVSKIINYLHVGNPILSYNTISKQAEDKYHKLNFEDGISSQLDVINRKVGIFSTSMIPDNDLLWAHYGSNHAGFCVELNGHVLREAIFELGLKHKIVVFAQKVIYQEEGYELLPSKLNDDEFVILPLVTKKKMWSYEKEYRFFLLDKQNFKVKMPPEFISSVIFGARMSKSDEKEITKLSEARNFTFKKAVVNKFSQNMLIEDY